MKISQFLIVFCLLTATKVFATVDYLVVNHITIQLYWAETDHPPGLIGWKGVGEIYKAKEKKYLDLGYTYTENPFVIEEGIVLVIILFMLLYWFIRKRKNRSLGYVSSDLS